MTVNQLIARLESLGYLFVTFQDGDDKVSMLTAVEPQGYQIEIMQAGGAVYDRKIGAQHWDIMFIGDESYL